jgi:hypothetical protein
MDGSDVCHKTDHFAKIDYELAAAAICVERGRVGGRVRANEVVAEEDLAPRVILRKYGTAGKYAERQQTRKLFHD